jgi:hypothetical protein
VRVPHAAATDRRFMTAAWIGTKMERKASMRSTTHSAMTAAITRGSRCEIRCARST